MVANSEYHKTQESGIRDEDNESTRENNGSDNDISDEDDLVLLELGESSEDEESDSENDQILLPHKSRTRHAQHI